MTCFRHHLNAYRLAWTGRCAVLIENSERHSPVVTTDQMELRNEVHAPSDVGWVKRAGQAGDSVQVGKGIGV